MRKTALILASVIIGLFISGCANTTKEEYTSQWSQEKSETLQLSNGMRVRYVRTGDGPPLVLLHTIRTQLGYFERLVPALRKKYQVYALDLPAHGQSSLPPGDYTEEFLRQAVSEFIIKPNFLAPATVMATTASNIPCSRTG